MVCCGCEKEEVIGSKVVLHAGNNRLKYLDDGGASENGPFSTQKAARQMKVFIVSQWQDLFFPQR